MRNLIVICCALCLTFTGFAQVSEVSLDESLVTSLEFTPIPIVKSLDKSKQNEINESYSDLNLQIPSAGMFEEVPLGFAKEGTWRWTMQFGFGMELEDTINRFAVGGFGFTYFPIDDFSLNVEFDGIYFDQDRVENAGGFNFNLLLRWHYRTEENWSAFFELAGGIVISDNAVPAGGAGFNFTPQVGAGLSLDVGNDVRLLTGVRWHHLSNGRTFDDNPGMDSIYGFVGLSMPF